MADVDRNFLKEALTLFWKCYEDGFDATEPHWKNIQVDETSNISNGRFKGDMEAYRTVKANMSASKSLFSLIFANMAESGNSPIDSAHDVLFANTAYYCAFDDYCDNGADPSIRSNNPEDVSKRSDNIEMFAMESLKTLDDTTDSNSPPDRRVLIRSVTLHAAIARSRKILKKDLKAANQYAYEQISQHKNHPIAMAMLVKELTMALDTDESTLISDCADYISKKIASAKSPVNSCPSQASSSATKRWEVERESYAWRVDQETSWGLMDVLRVKGGREVIGGSDYALKCNHCRKRYTFPACPKCEDGKEYGVGACFYPGRLRTGGAMIMCCKCEAQLHDWLCPSCKNINEIMTSLAVKGDACFLGSTPIDTPRGPIAIRELKVGDLVYAWSERQNSVVENTITRILVHSSSDCVAELWANQIASPIMVTLGHVFMTHHGWKSCNEILQSNAKLVRIIDGNPSECPVQRIFVRKRKLEPLYNLHTSLDHNYMVDGLIAHNFVHLRKIRTFIHNLLFDSNRQITQKCDVLPL